MKVLHIYQPWPVLPHQVRILLKNQSDFKLIYRKKADPKSSRTMRIYTKYKKFQENNRKGKKPDQRSIFSMKGTIIISLSWQKKVFDFDLKKMPKTETSNTTCIAKKNKAKPYVDFCQNTYRYKTYIVERTYSKQRKNKDCKFLKKSRSKQQKLQQNDDTY